MQSSIASSAPCSKAGPTSSSTPPSSSLPTGYVFRVTLHPSPTQGLYTSFAAPSTCLPRFSAPSPPSSLVNREQQQLVSSRREYISQPQLCSTTQLLGQDAQMEEMQQMMRSSGCKSHSMNFELSSGLQETLDTWCSSPRSKELEGGLIIRRDRSGGYELEPLIHPLSKSDSALMFGDAWPGIGAGPRRRQTRSFDISREHRVADAEVRLNEAILEDPLSQNSHPFNSSVQESTEFYDAAWKQSLSPCIEEDHRDSDKSSYLCGADFEDPSPEDSHSIKYWEQWSMDMNDEIVARQLGSECCWEQSRYFDKAIPFRGSALNIYSSSPFQFAIETHKADLSDMPRPSPENPSMHLTGEQSMVLNCNVVRNHRTSPWIKEGLRSSAMEIYFDEAVPEAYYLSPLRPNPQLNKASLSYILQSPPVEEFNDRSPPSSPTKPRYTSPNKDIGDDSLESLYFDEAMPEAYTPCPLMSSIETHMASLSYILQSSPSEKTNGRSPPLSPAKPKDTLQHEDRQGGGFSPGPFIISPGDNYGECLTESKILSGRPVEDTNNTPKLRKRKRGRQPGTPNNKKTLSSAQAKEIATTSLKRIETLRKRIITHDELPTNADSQEGNARKRKKKNRAELRTDQDNEGQPMGESGEFEKRLNMLGRIEAGNGRNEKEHGGGEDQENMVNWERVAYDPDL